MLYPSSMTELHLSPVHAMPTGLCEDAAGEATALIGRMAQGDSRALEEIFTIWGPTLLGIAQRMVGDPQEAEKVIQESFVRIWQAAADYNPHKSPPFVWAFTILRENCITHRQRRRNAKKYALAAMVAPTKHSEPAENSHVMPSDDWRRLRTAMSSLSAEECNCLETAVFLGYGRTSNQQSPDSLTASVKTSIRHALDVIRNQLSRYEL